MKTLIVVDMQNDFIDGSLGTKEAQSIVPNVVNKIKDFDGPIVCTIDTHDTWYLSTLEGKKLPVEHCIKDKDTDGWHINEDVRKTLNGKMKGFVEKRTFGYDWHSAAPSIKGWLFDTDEFEIIGLCTDICVISNALILRSIFPNKKITVDASCCAGVTTEKHKAALEVMKSCQIDIINE